MVISATLFSWIVLGIFYGFGYCFLTDWQWSVKRRLGETDLPNSFVKYAADWLTGTDINATVVDYVTAGTFLLIILITIYVNALRARD